MITVVRACDKLLSIKCNVVVTLMCHLEPSHRFSVIICVTTRVKSEIWAVHVFFTGISLLQILFQKSTCPPHPRYGFVGGLIFIGEGEGIWPRSI